MEECGRKNEVFTGNKPIDIEILISMRRSICKIIVDNKGMIQYGTGFFMKVSDSKRFLITNYHVIDIDSLNEKIEIEIWNKKKCILNPNNFNIKYLKEPKDIITLEFKDKLEKLTNLPVELEDERLTSKVANDVLISIDTSRKKRKERVDGMASVIILQSYLDRKGN